VLWGLYFGVLIGRERFVWGSALERAPRVLQHTYGVLVAVLGWVLFRAVDVGQAAAYYKAMVGVGVSLWDPLSQLTLAQGWVLIVISVILAAGASERLMSRLRRETMPVADSDLGSAFNAAAEPEEPVSVRSSVTMVVIVIASLALATVFMVSVSYSPFIYFRF
jgi:alginate O-acetyltransferase complex protein AlgI